MGGQFCVNCGASRRLGLACPYCQTAYEVMEQGDAGVVVGQHGGVITTTSAIDELGRSVAWLEAPASCADPELLDLAATEIDDAIDTGRLDAAIKLHQDTCSCDTATSQRIVNARIVARKQAWHAR